MPAALPPPSPFAEQQLRALNQLLDRIIPANPFYTRKLLEASLPRQYETLEEFTRRFPFTTKPEIVQDQERHPVYGRNLTYPVERYSRYHQTSGTTGQPIRWLDTAESWNVLVDCWKQVYAAAGVTSRDVIEFAFSFGPFLGFWLAFDAAQAVGSLCLPAGGMSTRARLQLLADAGATVLCGTPSYVLHLAEVAAAERIDLGRAKVRLLIVAGEPGGSIPATRQRLEQLWPGARVFDHHGMTEVGPVTYECPAQPCRLHLMDHAYLAEVIDPKSAEPVPPGGVGELVLTTLLRDGSPLLRYRTGDLVRLAEHHVQGARCVCGRAETALEGGILGRTDDMVVVRGVNIYPAAIEQIVRGFPDIVEYQVRVTRQGALTEMHLAIEPARTVHNPALLVAELEKVLQAQLNLRVPVAALAGGTLPRAELKARRWVRLEP